MSPKPILTDPFVGRNSQEVLAELDEIRSSAPVAYLVNRNIYLITGYQEVVQASRDYRTFSSTGGVGIDWVSQPMMPMYDPPDHTRLRRLVAPYFTPKAVANLAPVIRAEVLQAVRAATKCGKLDVVHGLAEPVAMATLAHVLGVDASMHSSLRRWAIQIMAALAGGLSAAEAATAETSRREFVRFLRELTEQRRAVPGEDLRSALLVGVDNDAMNDRELIAFCVLLFVAGFEPTALAIGNMIETLANQPELFAYFANASETQLGAAVEELVRLTSPVQAFFRNTLVDVQLAGCDIPRQSKVMLHFGAANRDPLVFDEPKSARVARTPNPHIAFGLGPHACLGGVLARAQLNIVAQVLALEVRALRISQAKRQTNLLFHGFAELVVQLQS